MDDHTPCDSFCGITKEARAMKIGKFLFIFCLVATFSLYAQVHVRISASKDNTLYESSTGTSSNGIGENFFVGKTNAGSIRRGLLAFDIASNIPAGSTIDSVKLTLFISRTASVSGQMIGLHRVLADWGEGTSNAFGNEGSGAPSTPGDATWIHRFFNTTSWTNAGGDFAVLPSASQAVGDIGFYTWGSTAQMIADVQEWLNNPSSNFGWLLGGNEGASQTAKRFDSRENATTVNRPALTIFYRTTTSIEKVKHELPREFSLSQNYPNPFNSNMIIKFYIPHTTYITLKIFDLFGREIETLANGKLNAGEYRVKWDASRYAGGIYFYRLQVGDVVETKRLIFLK
jgi:hypothetical protein